MRMLILFVLVLPAAAQSPPWTGILDASRGIDWSHSGATIPASRTQCSPATPGVVGGVVTPSGATDRTDANNINLAIQACAAVPACQSSPPGCYLQLSAGDFYIVDGVTFGGKANAAPAPGPFTIPVSNLTLRGVSPSSTTFHIMSGGRQDCGPDANAICILASNNAPTSSIYPYGGGCSWTAGYSKNTTVLTLANCFGPATASGPMPTVGQDIILDQRNDDNGLVSCSSLSNTATCVLAGRSTLPPGFTVGACVGIGAVGNLGWTNGIPSSIGSSSTVAGYNATLLTPQTLPPAPPAGCASPITAVGTDSITGQPTFSYTLPGGLSGLATPGACGISASNSANPFACYATVDTGGTTVTGNPCVTGDGSCANTGPGCGTFGCGYSSVTAALQSGRTCPDNFYNGTGSRPWPPTCLQFAGLDGHTYNEVSSRSQNQIVTVTAVSGNQVTISPALYGNNWRASQTPGVYWFAINTSPPDGQHDDGVENLTIDMRFDGGTTSNSGIAFKKCHNCWVRNVRSIAGSRSHMWMEYGNNQVTIRDSYFYGTKRGGTQSYGIETDGGNLLIENNIFVNVVSGIMNAGGMGSVQSYNYFIGDGQSTPNVLSGGIAANHDVNGWNLLEGNNAPLTGYDNIHGTISGPITHFRERARGQSCCPAKGGFLHGAQVSAFNRGVNFIGNVFGTASITNGPSGQTVYQTFSLSQCGVGHMEVFCLDLTSQAGNNINDDALVHQSMFRWGNFDVVTLTQSGGDGTGIRWCGTGAEANCGGVSEVPTTAFGFLPAVTVPGNHTLPASFYLTGKPVWWNTKFGTAPFPAIGPDIHGGDSPDEPNGHVYAIPAQRAWQHLAIDSVYASPNTLTGGSWSPNVVTLTGQFTAILFDSFQISNANPSSYNGIYATSATSGPGADSIASGGLVAGGAVPSTSTTYQAETTRVNRFGETIASGKVGGLNPPSSCNGTTPTGNCTLNINVPCQFSAPTNCLQGGSPVGGVSNDIATGYNVYIGIQGDVTGKLCLQNASPLPIGSGSSFNYHQTAAIIYPTVNNDGVTPNPNCITPPTVSTAYSTAIQGSFLFTNPNGTLLSGTVTSPMVQVFDANSIYGQSSVTPSAVLQGVGSVKGVGVIQ